MSRLSRNLSTGRGEGLTLQRCMRCDAAIVLAALNATAHITLQLENVVYSETKRRRRLDNNSYNPPRDL